MRRYFSTGNLVYYFLLLTFASVFLAANKVKVKRYTPWQMKVWSLKSSEGYRSWWYKDGKITLPNGKRVQTYSIGMGYNDQGSWKRRKAIAKYTADGRVTYKEALEISLKVDCWQRKYHNDPYVNLAMQMYAYNRGTITSPKQLGRCCGGKWGCGHAKASVRRAHNPRRQEELAIARKDWVAMQKFTEEHQKKASQMDRLHK